MKIRDKTRDKFRPVPLEGKVQGEAEVFATCLM